MVGLNHVGKERSHLCQRLVETPIQRSTCARDRRYVFALHRFIGQSIGPSVADQYMQHLGHIQHVRQVENTIVVIERVDIDGCRSPIVQPNGLASTLQIEALLHHACRFLTGTASIMTFPPAYVRHPLHTTTYRRHSTALRHLPPGI